jgi:hypothetical protein
MGTIRLMMEVGVATMIILLGLSGKRIILFTQFHTQVTFTLCAHRCFLQACGVALAQT